MPSKNMLELLNYQINAEFYSAYLYISMSSYCEQQGYQGFASWMYIQAQEELAHGTHLLQHLLERGEAPQLEEIHSPPREYENLLDVFSQQLRHEQYVTECIGNIATQAIKDKDHASHAFIQWYVLEQVEEEASAGVILQRLKLAESHPAMLFSMDLEMAGRSFINPFPA